MSWGLGESAPSSRMRFSFVRKNIPHAEIISETGASHLLHSKHDLYTRTPLVVDLALCLN
jgi:hypothetical protein